MVERRKKQRVNEVAFHRLPDSERKEIRMQILVNRETFDSLCQIAYNRNRKVSDLSRCVLLDFVNSEKMNMGILA